MDEEECVTGVAGDSAHPLLRAVYLRRLRLTRLLLEGGAYINESDRHGQTPLMVACRTQHADGQSASRAKLLKYLLERGADPNIQDQDGRSALMHACREHAGPELVALLLAGGADLGLEDQSGTSALVYAVTAGDQKVLRLLLDSYKGQGKEVIIITTDSVPNGRARARQYRHGLAPHLALDVGASQAPASPSEIQIITSPLGPGPGSSSGPHKQVFSFKESQCFACSGGNSNPCSPTRLREPGLREPGPQQRQRWAGRLQQQPLLRLNSEPWLKIPASAGSSRVPPAVVEPPPPLPENRPWESGPPKVEVLHGRPKPDGSESGRKASNSNNSQNTYPTPLVSYDRFGAPRGPGIAIVTDGLNQSNPKSAEEKRGSQAGGGEEGAGEEALVPGGDHKRGHHTISLPGISSPHSASHPNLHTPQHPAGGPGGTVSPSCGKAPGVALSGLDSIIHRRKLGADHYASDPQLTLKTPSLEETQERARAPPAVECRRLATLRSSTLGGSGSSASRESLEGPGPVARRAVPWFERRGSGAFLLDQGSGQYPPRSLPPLQLNPQYTHSPVGGGGRAARTAGHDPPCEKIAGLKTFVPCAPPGHPKEVSRRALLRRHSMQSEQLKAA